MSRDALQPPRQLHRLVEIRKAAPGLARGIFVEDAWVKDGKACARLEPGRYEVELYRRWESAWTIREYREPTRTIRKVVVQADGTIVPAILRF